MYLSNYVMMFCIVGVLRGFNNGDGAIIVGTISHVCPITLMYVRSL